MVKLERLHVYSRGDEPATYDMPAHDGYYCYASHALKLLDDNCRLVIENERLKAQLAQMWRPGNEDYIELTFTPKDGIERTVKATFPTQFMVIRKEIQGDNIPD